MAPQARRRPYGVAFLTMHGHRSIPSAWACVGSIGATCPCSTATSSHASTEYIGLQFSLGPAGSSTPPSLQGAAAGQHPVVTQQYQWSQEHANGSNRWGCTRPAQQQWIGAWLAAAAASVLQGAARSWLQPKARPMLLASLTSATANHVSTSHPAASGGARKQQPRRLQQVPQLLSVSVPEAFQRAQQTAWAIWEYYKEKGEAFPRPCPGCGSCSFFEPGASSSHLEAGTAAVPDASMPIKWESRPLACEQCHRWWHMGCLGIQSLQDVPNQPWFHANSCRHTYLAMECEAERRELPAWELGPDAGRYSVSLMTESDHRHFVTGDQPLCRGDMASVYELLSDALPGNLLLGLGNARSEYAGGRYTMLLCRRDPPAGKATAPQRTPVAAATFDVYGPHAAQLHLLATAEDERGRGHARALLDVLEYRLQSHGVTRLIAQPRADQLQLFIDRLGFEVLHPADAAVAHQQIPIAFFDAVLVDKRLTLDRKG